MTTDYPGGGYGGSPPNYGEQPGYGQQPWFGHEGYGQQYGQPGYGNPVAPPGPPPPRKRKPSAMVAGIVAVLVVAGGLIAAVLLTGDNSTDGTPSSSLGTGGAQAGFPSGTDSSSVPSGGSATGVYYTVDFLVSDYFDDLDSQDYDGITQLTCEGYSTRLSTTDVSEVASAESSGAAKVSGSSATAAGSVVLIDGTSRTLNITMTEQPDQKWCVSSETAIR